MRLGKVRVQMKVEKLGINDYHKKLGYVPASEIKRLRKQLREQMNLVKLAMRILEKQPSIITDLKEK